MARDWRRLAVTALAAASLALACALSAHAQTQAPKKKAKAAPQPEAEQTEGAEKTEPPKKKKQDPVEAQRAIEAAIKQLQAGRAQEAAQALTATLGGGNLPPALMAKALYARGIAHRQLTKTAEAISDLTSALWLKGGLAEADRVDALQQRAGAYRDAGLGGEQAEVQNAALLSGSRGKEQAAAPAASGWNLLNPFGIWSSPAPQQTGSIQKQATAPAAPPPAVQTPAIQPPPAAPRPQSSAWANTTEVRTGADPPVTPAAAPAPPPAAAPAPAAAKPAGKYRLQLATVRTEQEAQAVATKLQREHAAALAAREPEIDQAVLGNMGSFYRVRIGPYATLQETQAVCAKLKGSGLDCMAVTQ
jgi:cell division septation protein DedD